MRAIYLMLAIILIWPLSSHSSDWVNYVHLSPKFSLSYPSKFKKRVYPNSVGIMANEKEDSLTTMLISTVRTSVNDFNVDSMLDKHLSDMITKGGINKEYFKGFALLNRGEVNFIGKRCVYYAAKVYSGSFLNRNYFFEYVFLVSKNYNIIQVTYTIPEDEFNKYFDIFEKIRQTIVFYN